MIRGLILALALATPAGAIDLALPADCTLGDTCYIQQYFDHDPGPGAQDFTCGGLSYDGHDGTDIALPSRAAMAAGVAVLAAAAGTVTGTRDGLADFTPVVPGKECGNGVIIDHGQGWQTQYCHMKQGSITVHPGDSVTSGTPLGQIGQTGLAEFPHLHLTLRHDGHPVDPFASDTPATCSGPSPELWAGDLAYQPGGLLAIGIADALPDYDAIKAGLASPDLPVTAPALVVWAFLYGGQTGDEIRFTLTGPEGAVVDDSAVLDKAQAQAFRAVGRKLKTAGWPAGPYTGTARLIRRGAELGRKEITLTVTP